MGALTRLARYAVRHRRTVGLASASSVLNKVFDLAPPALIGMAVDTVVERDASLLARMGASSVESQLVWIALATVVIWGLESVFEFAEKWIWRNLAQTIQHELRLDAYTHVQKLEMGWFEDRSTGHLMAVLNDDVNQLERFLDGGANDLLQVATTVLVIGAAFFWISPGVAVLSLLPIPVILWGSFRFQDRIAPRYAEVREAAAQVSGQLANNITGIETVKGFTAEHHEVERIRALSEAYRTANRGAIGLSSAFSPLIRMVIVVGFTATLVYGGLAVIWGDIAVGSYSVLVFLTQRLLWPLTRLGATVDLYQRAMASTDRVLDLLDTKPTIVTGKQPLGTVAGDLRFRDVTFGYADREPIFRGFSLHIPAGSTLAVVGPTGSGKSTLVRLLLRFREPQQGSVELDGANVRSLDLSGLRQSIGLVSQHTYLFSGSVADNIRYGSFSADDEAVQVAAVAAEADAFIQELPEGMDTPIGERGQKLSGGQRQRLAIARAFVKDPPILVLDEATSAVDNRTEEAIQRSLARVSTGRTTLIIAHRLSTIRHADRIVVLDQGAVVESGTHEELVRGAGLYQHLWAVQTGDAA
jgi:ATP-binding cassette, subfamily B, bacterial